MREQYNDLTAKKIGSRLRQIREGRGLTQKEEPLSSSFCEENKKKVLKTYIISIDILTKRCIISLVRSNI